MKSKKSILSIAIFLLIAFVIAGCGVIPTQPKGAIEGRVLVPPSASEMSKDVSGWVPAAGATVTVVDANGVTHTVTTDEDGYYSFENIAVNPNTVVTATVEVDGKTIVLKKVIPDAVAEDEDYDAGTMTPESTALALVVETLVDEGVEPEDIYLGEILGSDSFEDLVENVTTAIEEEKDVTEDPDVTGGAGDIADEILNPPTPPSPPSGPSTISVTGVTLDRTTLTLTAGGDTGTLTATVAPANATNKNVTWTSSDETVATVADGVVTPVAAGTAVITVITEDGNHTVEATVTVEEILEVAAPTFSVEEGIYVGAQEVSLSSATVDAIIYYTTDESEPTTESTLYSIPITISEDTILKAFAVKEGMSDSTIVSATYTITYAVGERGQAGLVFYDKGSYSDDWRYLEAAPSDIVTENDCYNHVFGIYRAVPLESSYPADESAPPPNAVGTETEVGSGRANTTALVNAMGTEAYVSLAMEYNATENLNIYDTTTTDKYAARLADTLVIGDYADWFLPSKEELDLMWNNLKDQGLGDFAEEFYWSSSEGFDPAFLVYASDGQMLGLKNGYEYRVRAVRSF